MSYALEDTNKDHPGAGGVAPSNIGQPNGYRISRSGARPLKFNGSELAMAMSFTPEIPYWYEINLYRTTESDFVAAVRLFHQSEDKLDTVEAWRCKSLDEALTSLEHYDAANDVEVTLIAPGKDMAASEVAAASLELHARIHAQRQHYRGLVGEILHELDAG